MKYSVSNIALSPCDHLGELQRLPEMGFQGLEVALSRVWPEDWNNPSSTEVRAYRQAIENAGLTIVGLHSLFWDRPNLSLFGDKNIVAETMDFLVHMSEICRDLGGRTLIYGSQTARTRDGLSLAEANAQAIEFFGTLCHRIRDHGTCFCFEPLETDVADFINSVSESLAIVEAVNHPALKVQVDVKALVANDEANSATIEAVAAHLVHVHANEPGLGVLGSSGQVDHAAIGAILRNIDYQGFVSIEQRMLNPENPLADVLTSSQHLKECYP